MDAVPEHNLALNASQEDYLGARDVMRAVERLPEDYRSVLLLVTVEELTYAEIAPGRSGSRSAP